MMRRIYELLHVTGRVKSAVILEGPCAGRRFLFAEGRVIIDEPENDRNGSGHLQTDRQMIPEQLRRLLMKTFDETEETSLVKCDGVRLFVEIYLQNPRLVLLGGGHVSCPAAKIGKMLGFHVTVMDDREEFLTQERFPDADERILGGFSELSEKIMPYENTYYVVLTRGHAGDTICARQILKRPYTYFGMIGSRSKVKLTREKLLAEGFSTEQLASIHAPIGLPIGGRLPEEIAVSIMAEIVQVKNSRYAVFSDERISSAVLEGRHGCMLTIIQKSGSSPRGVGSKLFLDEEGKAYGSIGGGSVEYEAMNHAPSVTGWEHRSYNLSSENAGSLGMICGGTIDILFEKI